MNQRVPSPHIRTVRNLSFVIVNGHVLAFIKSQINGISATVEPFGPQIYKEFSVFGDLKGVERLSREFSRFSLFVIVAVVDP